MYAEKSLKIRVFRVSPRPKQKELHIGYKISFAISLILFFVLVTWGEPQKIRFLTILLRLILGFIVSASALLISVRAETRILIIRRFIFRQE